MNATLNNLSIRARMLLAVTLFLATLLFSMYGAYDSVGAGAAFAAQEKKGNAWQRPLASMLRDAGRLRLALVLARDGMNSGAEIKRALDSIGAAVPALKRADAEIGAALQFTDAGLESRGRGHLAPEKVLARWRETEKAVAENIRGDHDAAVAGFIADLRGMIAHSGDTSNLILDPDLDSYYLMDVTLLAAPQTLDRLSAISASLYGALRQGAPSAAARTEAAVMARLLKEADIDRIAADMDTATKEDPNFYGVNAAFHEKMPPLLKDYIERNGALAAMLAGIGAGETPSAGDFAAAAVAAGDSAFALLDGGYDALDAFLDSRIADYSRQQMVSILVALAGIVLSMAFYMVVVGSITRPLRALTDAMDALAAGKTDTAVPYAGARSEIGHIASALMVFRKAAHEKASMEAQQKQAEEESRRARRAEMQNLAQSFEGRIKGIIDALGESAAGLSGTADNMAGFISKSARSAGDVSRSAETTSQNVQSVAAAAEEMAVTVQEISAQVQRTNQFISDTVQKAAGADRFAVQLSSAAQKVRDVTRLIAEISAQTNLLALNATIEAARAGDAGKGFAVVATEVKNLASQTDKSIQDIENVISEMNGATEGVVAALSGIKGAVDSLYESSSGIATAVEEQSATINDIVKNMQAASGETMQVSQNIRTVTQLSDEASRSSQQVLEAAGDLSRRADDLDREVASFLSEVQG